MVWPLRWLLAKGSSLIQLEILTAPSLYFLDVCDLLQDCCHERKLFLSVVEGLTLCCYKDYWVVFSFFVFKKRRKINAWWERIIFQTSEWRNTRLKNVATLLYMKPRVQNRADWKRKDKNSRLWCTQALERRHRSLLLTLVADVDSWNCFDQPSLMIAPV